MQDESIQRMVVRTEADGDVAVILIDNPPINAGSQAVRLGLLTAINDVRQDARFRAAAILGAGTTFIAGSDIREFGQPLADPQLPEVIAAIETCEKPIIAALHGAALGGGFELALGCDARVALPGTVVGFPEVTLGIIPGAGGTQRMPRLTGVPRALALVCGGVRVPADQALLLGLVDKVVDGGLRAEAVAYARTLTGKRRVRDLAVPECSGAEVADAAESARRAGKNRPAVRAAVEAVTSTLNLPIEEGLAKEREAFQTLRGSREARALRYLFFAEREATKGPATSTFAARPLKNIAVIGAGTMGSGIAIAALDAGFNVTVLEQAEAALARGIERIRTYFSNRVKAGKVDADQAEKRQASLHETLDWSAISDVDLVIEAVFEDMAAKQEVFRRLDKVMRPDALLASNTSYLDLDAIASVTSRPQNVVGLHFFAPANVMKLLEIVRGTATSVTAVATCLQFAKRLKKISVISANAFGFIGNRIYAAYRRQCEFMLEEGATPQQVDAALESFGFAMGPFAVADLSGLDIAWRMRQSLAATRDPKARYVRIPDMLCEAGRLGQKTGAGYYRYEQPGAKRQHDPAVDQILSRAREEKGITPRTLSDQEIVQRVLLSMANESAHVLQEQVAARASDIDVVLINGYGFPKWEGGPMFWAQDRSLDELEKDLDWLAERSGPGFIRGDARKLLPSL